MLVKVKFLENHFSVFLMILSEIKLRADTNKVGVVLGRY